MLNSDSKGNDTNAELNKLHHFGVDFEKNTIYNVIKIFEAIQLYINLVFNRNFMFVAYENLYVFAVKCFAVSMPTCLLLPLVIYKTLKSEFRY